MFICYNVHMKKYTFWIICIILLCWLAIFSFQKIDLSTADIGRHIQNGNVFLHSAEFGVSRADLLYTNFFSYTYPNFPFINHHWGSGVLFYLIYIFSGFSGLSVFYFLCIACAFVIMVLAVRHKTNLTALFLASIFLIPLIADRTEVRPEGLSFVFLSLFFFLLYRFSRNSLSGKKLFLLPLVEILWVNTHIFFIFGIYLAGIFFAESLVKTIVGIAGEKEKTKTLGKVLSLTVLGSLVSPYFIRGVIYPFIIFKNYGYRIVENQSIPFLENLSFHNPSFLWYKIALALVIFSTIFVIWRFIRKSKNDTSAYGDFSFAPIILTLTFAVLGFFGIRYIALFGLFSLPILIFNFSVIKKWLDEKMNSRMDDFKIIAGILLFCIIIFGSLWQFQSHLPWNRDFGLGIIDGEMNSIDFIKQNNLRGPIFNNYDLGGMMIFDLWPNEKVFVDNRPETYPASFFSNIYIPMQENPNVWQAELQKENFNMIYFQRLDYTPWAQKFLLARVSDPDWAPVYVDDRTIIFLRRNSQNSTLIKKFELPKSMFSTK